ncbi:hypothetical protein Droror1_Dr00004485 [Drosera rotundifolia]
MMEKLNSLNQLRLLSWRRARNDRTTWWFFDRREGSGERGRRHKVCEVHSKAVAVVAAECSSPQNARVEAENATQLSVVDWGRIENGDLGFSPEGSLALAAA